jgi:hypothetical protein
MRAFQAAKGLTQSKAPLDDDTINRKEFQDLLGYLRQYFELYVMFAVRLCRGGAWERERESGESGHALPGLEQYFIFTSCLSGGGGGAKGWKAGGALGCHER